MKILAIYPGLNPVYDEVAYALPPLLAHGCAVRVITSKVSALKSADTGDAFENFGGVEIFRLYDNLQQLSGQPGAHWARVQQLVAEFQPDLLLVNSFHSLPLLRLLRSQYALPVVLRVESADPLVLLQRRYYLGLPALGRVVGRAKWRQVASEVSAIMTNDPVDLGHLARLAAAGRRTYYAGHCAQRPAGVALAPQRDRGEMIYIGSLIRHKNCERWLETVPRILEQTPVERFTVIGRGPYQHVVDTLRQRYGERINYLPGVTRAEALQRLSGAYFAYTESSSGWGFLCDAWSTATPVLCPQSTFNIVPGWTGIMPDRAATASAVQRLYDDPAYYRNLQRGGGIRYDAEHTAEIVSLQYLQIFKEVVAACGATPALLASA
jgi:glycosyltransferase involved in cell wall biosynthesis